MISNLGSRRFRTYSKADIDAMDAKAKSKFEKKQAKYKKEYDKLHAAYLKNKK